MSAATPRNVLVVIGTGGMGQAAARRLASGRKLFIADFSRHILNSTVESLKNEGHDVEGHILDVSDGPSVKKFAALAGQAGHIDAIIHTAGVSPVMATSKRIYEVNLLGTANVIDAFLPVASAGTSMICIASLAGYTAISAVTAELEKHLATAPTDQLLHHEAFDLSKESYESGGEAYRLAKRANQLRVQAAAFAWGSKGARINSISPGVIATSMGKQELDGPGAEKVRGLVGISATRRLGTPDDIANAVAFLAGPESSFITGSDLLIDGGAWSSIRWNREAPPAE